MIKDIASGELNRFLGLVCSYCGEIFNSKMHKEGRDYFFQRNENDGDEWCICSECRELNKLSRKYKKSN